MLTRRLLPLSTLLLSTLIACNGTDVETTGSGGSPSSTTASGGGGGGGQGGGGGSTDPVCGDGKLDIGEQCDDGNKVSGDGCQADCTNTVAEVVVCETLAPLAQGTCEVTAGDASKLIVGDVLTPGKIYRGGQVLVDAAGAIACVGCGCDADAASATKIVCPQGVVSPALINTHDHITYAQNSPYTDTGERYEHRHDWREGKNGHTKITTPGKATTEQISWGELRFLMGGATSTVGSGSAAGLLRNLDRAADEEGLGVDYVDFETFPLGDSDGKQLASGCGYKSIASMPAKGSFLPHVAEGINAFASNEFSCLSSTDNGGKDLLEARSSFIHSVGLTARNYAEMAKDGATIIWSPRSNITLYGDTAIVTQAARFGARIALGTDWVATGSMNMVRELVCADEFNRNNLGGFFTDEQLWLMTTSHAAAALGAAGSIGTLAPGKVADISIWNGSAHKDYRAIIDSKPSDVALVMRGGKVLYGDESLVSATGTGCDTIDVCGTSKQVCLKDEVGKTYSELKAAANSYAAFFCDLPDNEPSCVPMRNESVQGSSTYDGIPTSTDADGDGIADDVDVCPTIFDPIRPMDGGKQADVDGDGVGDACDVCPLDADTTTCTVYNSNDSDGDGISNDKDNCPNVANPEQDDTDKDGHGDACDACPDVANPGSSACPASIYAVKNGTIPEGSAVKIENAIVTAKYSAGFYIQVKPGDAAYAGEDYSGLYVYVANSSVKPGDRVTIENSTVTYFYNQIELTSPTVSVLSSGEALPDPIVVASSAEVKTGGTRAKQLEAVLVELHDVSVTNIAPAVGGGETAPTNEFVVNSAGAAAADGVRVNDIFYKASPFPIVGDSYSLVRGILNYRNDNSKIEPRFAADLVPGKARLESLTPASAFVQVDGTTDLTVTLNIAAPAETVVSFASSDDTALEVPATVTIPKDSQTATLSVKGLAQAAAVTVTASYDGVDVTSKVRVLAADEEPVLASLTPTTATAMLGGTVTFTASLDFPAKADTVVTLGLDPVDANVLPLSVTIPAGSLSATFDFTAGDAEGAVTVSATLGAVTLDATVTLSAAPEGALVINEVDYDDAGTENNEFIEIYNGSSASVDLSDYAIVLLNGSSGAGKGVVYTTINLTGTLAAGQYLVISSDAVVVAPGALRIAFAAQTLNIQNGDPDGIALVKKSTNSLVDALSYGGSITAAVIPGLGTVSLVHGTPTKAKDIGATPSVAASLCRLPNGFSTGDDDTDWKLSKKPTPGEANVLN